MTEPKKSDTTRLVLMPGLGGDARMYSAQIAAFPGTIVAAWLPPLRDEPLREYAVRMAAQPALRGVRAGEFVLAGASFGGMLSLEMAAVLRPAKVVLMGSCREPGAIAAPIRKMELASRLLPDALLGGLKRFGAAAVDAMGPLDDASRVVVDAMMRDVEMGFVRWAGRAIMAWPGCVDPGVPVVHVHGSRDRVIMCRRVRANVVIKGAGHVPNMTHASEVNAVIAGAMEGVS